MNNKILLFVVGALLLGGVFVLSKNQKSSVTTSTQKQSAVNEKNEEVKENGVEETGTENEQEAEDKEEQDEANEDVTVRVTDAGFEPQTLTVKAGTKVVWKNNTQVTANVSSAQHPTHLVYPPLNLGNFEPEKAVSLVFEEPGSYNYHDHLNPSKFGTVVVE